MNVAIYPADNDGCAFYRLTEPARVLADTGHGVTVISYGDNDTMRVYANRRIGHQPAADDPIGDIENLPDADIIIFQRPQQREMVNIVAWLQTNGYRVIIEVDDNFHALHARNVAATEMRGDTHPRHLYDCCQLADLVTVTTPALAHRYGAHGRVAILPNLIPAAYLDIERPTHEGVNVGWSGSLQTHPEDLQVCGGAIAQVIQRTGCQFTVIGTGIGVQRALGLPQPPMSCGWLELDIYPHALAHLDVGIVPLQASPFNESKSALKMLEMTSVGVAVVGSPTFDNRRVAGDGIGQIACKPREWRSKVLALATNAELRADFAGRARIAAARHTYEEHADRWWQAWQRALNPRGAAA